MTTKYQLIEHHNSNRARNRGLCDVFWNPKTLKVEHRKHVSAQIVKAKDPKAPNTFELLHAPNPAVARYARGRYHVPFVGLKQQRKIEGLA